MWKPFPLLLIFVVISCSTGPEFDRSNENDPGTANFVPDTPSGANYSFNTDTSITLTWDDNTDFETGYFVRKSIGQNFNELIATLPPNSFEFRDSTKEFGFPTSYRIAAEKDGSRSDSITVNIDFGTITQFGYTITNPILSGKPFNLSWNDDVSFEDGFFILINTDQEESDRVLEILPPDMEEIRMEVPATGFSHVYKIKPFRIFEGDTTVLETNSSATLTNAPENLQMNLLSEDSLLVTWNFSSDFHDNYLLEFISPSGSRSYEIAPEQNSFVINENIDKQTTYIAKLVAVYNQKTSPRLELEKQFSLNPLQINEIISVSNTSVKLEVQNNPSVRLTKSVFRKDENSDFVKIGEIGKGESSYTDTGINESNIYTYYIETPLTNRSTEKQIYYKSGLKKVNAFNLDNDIRFIGNYVDIRSNSLLVSDWNTDQLLNIDYLSNTPVTEYIYDFYPMEIAVHQNQNIMAAIKGTEADISLDITENGTITSIENLSLGNTGIGSIEFISGKIYYLVKKEDTDWQLTSSSLDGLQKDILLTFTSPGDVPSMVTNQDKTELLLTVFKNNGEIELQKYSLSGSSVTLQRNTIVNDSPINFSPTLDSVIVSNGQYNLSVLNLNTNNIVFSQEFNLYNSNSLRKSFFFGNKLLYAPDQAGAYIVDTKNQTDPILQLIGYKCCSMTYVGAFWDKLTNHIIDMRNSNTSFYSVYSIETLWREVYIDN